MIYEKNEFIRKIDDDFQDSSLNVKNNDVIWSGEQIQAFTENCTTIHFDATLSICRTVPEAKKRICL